MFISQTIVKMHVTFAKIVNKKVYIHQWKEINSGKYVKFKYYCSGNLYWPTKLMQKIQDNHSEKQAQVQARI